VGNTTKRAVLVRPTTREGRGGKGLLVAGEKQDVEGAEGIFFISASEAKKDERKSAVSKESTKKKERKFRRPPRIPPTGKGRTTVMFISRKKKSKRDLVWRKGMIYRRE